MVQPEGASMEPEHQNEQDAGLQGFGKSRSRAGISVLEALVALTIFAVFATGACKILVAHREILDMARDHYTAANIAKNRMEMVRTLDFPQIPQLNEDPIQVDASGIASKDGHFRRKTTITTLNTNLYKLAITVQIQDRRTLQFDKSEETINTYVSKHL